LGGGIRQVEHKLIKSMSWVPRLPQTDNLQVHRATGEAKDRAVQAIAVMEGFQNS
jgi:hypothetical protein